MNRLRVALIGLGGVGEKYLAAIEDDDQFDLVAIADTDREALHRVAATVSASAYEDVRSLLVETGRTGLDVLFAALEPFVPLEFLELSGRRAVPVFCKAPIVRNVREMQRVIRVFEESRAPLVVSRSWPSDSAVSGVDGLLQQVGAFRAATARVRTTDKPVGWRGDSARAGGGVLLHGAYDTVDFLVKLLGFPEAVYAQCTFNVAAGGTRHYDTEDVAMVALRFRDEQLACLTATRGVGEACRRIELIGSAGIVEVDSDGVRISTEAGHGVEHHPVETAPPVGSAISAFGAALRTGAKKIASTAAEHLTTAAVIDAAYLSARTGAPESPRGLIV